jgi:Leucine Rich repeats (2 copies)
MEIKSSVSNAVLGKGYNSKKERFAGECLKQEESVFVGAQSASLRFSRSLEQNELSEALGFSAGGKARYGVVSGSAAANFASEASSNDYSEVTIYSANYRFKNKKLKYTGLSEVGKNAKGFRDNNNFVGEQWELICGHEFVEEITLGASIYISAKIEFANKAAKQSFNASFKIQGPAFEASGEFSRASKSFGSSASITIQAFQLGGDGTRLSAIFGGNDNLIDSGGKQVQALVVCSMSNPEPCLQILTSAVDYATNTDDPDAFPNQIKPDMNVGVPTGPAELSYITSPYSDLALIPPPAIISDGIKAAREELSFEFEKNFAYQNRLRAIKTGKMRLSQRQQKNIEDIEKDVAGNLAIIQTTADICYKDLDNCVSAVSEAKQKIKTIDEENLEIFPETIAQWYDVKDLPGTKKSIEHTLNVLTEKVKNQVVKFEEVEDKAAKVEELLLGVKHLDLDSVNSSEKSIDLELLLLLKNLKTLNISTNQIVDLSPLSLFTKLEGLNLSNNQIVDLAPLSVLINLKSLNIGDNKIVDINPLSSLTNLTSLGLLRNQIVDVSPLASLTKLVGLYLDDNQIVDVSPLASLTNLTSFSLAYNQIIDISPLVTLTKLEGFNLQNNQIVDVSPLSSLVKPKWLFMLNNPISNKTCPVPDPDNTICHFN